MPSNIPPARNSSRANNSQNGHRHRADFARQATIAAFGRHARALDWDDFVDRQPDQAPRRINDRIARRAA